MFRRGIAEVRRVYVQWLRAITPRDEDGHFTYLDACGNKITQWEYEALVEEQLREDYPEWMFGSW